MTATAVRAGRRRPSAARRWWWRHPEVPAVALCSAAWVYLAVDHWLNHDRDVPWSFAPFSWAAMVVAMMVPAVVPMIRLVAFDSPWNRRHRAPAIFLASYVVVWTGVPLAGAAGIALLEQLGEFRFDPGVRVVTASLLVAAGWQFTDQKQRALRRCHMRTPLGWKGWKADRAAIRYGVFHARACIASCGTAMAAMFVSRHDFHLMIPLTVILGVERLVERPRPRAGGAAMIALAAFTTVTEVLG